jgi:hypothetical protein
MLWACCPRAAKGHPTEVDSTTSFFVERRPTSHKTAHLGASRPNRTVAALLPTSERVIAPLMRGWTAQGPKSTAKVGGASQDLVFKQKSGAIWCLSPHPHPHRLVFHLRTWHCASHPGPESRQRPKSTANALPPTRRRTSLVPLSRAKHVLIHTYNWTTCEERRVGR